MKSLRMWVKISPGTIGLSLNRLFGYLPVCAKAGVLSQLITRIMQANENALLVSIAVATFNGERFISAQLDSLLTQTYSNVEIVISDDGSTDDTVNIISRYARIHPQISVYNNTSEKGVRKNFEHAIKHCKGNMIALCDQDDIWLPGKIAQLVDGIGSASLIYHDSLLVDESGKSLGKRTVTEGYSGTNPMVFMLKNVVSGHACLFRRELIIKALPFPDGICHDWWLAAVAADNAGIKYCPQPLVHYRQHAGNVSDFMQRRSLNSKRTARELYDIELTRFGCFIHLKRCGSFFQQWFELNESKTTRWFCFKLFYLCFQNRKQLFVLHNKSGLSVFFRCLGFLWGFMLKRLVDSKYNFQEQPAASISVPGYKHTGLNYPAALNVHA